MNSQGRLLRLWIAALLFVSLAHSADRVAGSINFYGYKGLDLDQIRAAVGLKPGDEIPAGTKKRVSAEILRVTGKPVTDFAAICCDENGRYLVFVGIAGASTHPFAYRKDPTGATRLAPEAAALYDRTDKAIEAAVRKGGVSAQEDDSLGYALIRDPAARALQIEEHKWAGGHQAELISVLSGSANVEDRRAASELLGYSNASPRQIAALVDASRDGDDEVRNNATRALGVLAESDRKLAKQIPAAPFIEMLTSGIWTDRNKAAALLARRTNDRDPDVLAKLRASAFDALIEMSRWPPSHGTMARIVLGRVAGLSDDKINELLAKNDAESIIRAALGKQK